jgi:lipopolysaccharide/colanic/teichoic acid biosynthesis glycosyltransferase
MYKRIGKRLFDVLLTIPALTVVALLMGLIAFFVRIKLGRPIIFRQERPGLNGELFTLFKFRTMTDSRDSQGKLLPDAERLTSFGRFLRITSLDELPELFNVLRGDMSLVGPRPLLIQYLDLYTPDQARRHEVKPGITGMTQVSGRNTLTWAQKFAFDMWYVDNMKLWLDVKILAMTVWKILKREGISQPGQATMEKFHGTGGEHGG